MSGLHSDSSKRWLYLDFDGVLHPDSVYIDRQGNPELRHDSGRLFMYEDRLAMALAPYPEVKIILSTTWAVRLGLERTKGYLSPKIRNRVIGQSGPLRIAHLRSRAHEVERHVREHLPDQWIIIDDDPYDWSDMSIERLVLCDPELGLGEERSLVDLNAKLVQMTAMP